MASLTAHTPPRATLYNFEGSLWGSTTSLGLSEKGFSDDDYVVRQVNLLKGENFSPEFLRINPKGTVPTLVVPQFHTLGDHIETRFTALTDSIKVLEFLDKSRKSSSISSEAAPAPALAPATIDTKALSDSLISLVHSDDAPDGNMLLISVRDEDELKFKLTGVPYKYLKGRQDALNNYTAGAEEATNSMKAFLKDRLTSNGSLLAIYEGTASPEAKAAFFELSKKAWQGLPVTLGKLAEAISSNGGDYLLGAQLSLADIHAGAWIARVLAVAGVGSVSEPEPIAKLQSAMGAGSPSVPAPIAKYWATLAARPSFQKVYAAGLH